MRSFVRDFASPPVRAVLCLSALALGLSGCGDDDRVVTVDDLDTGAYVVSVGDANAPTVGRYFAAADGSRLLLLEDTTTRAQQSYRRAADGSWVAVPGTSQDVTVRLLQSNVVPDTAPSVAALAGRYVTQLASGALADFTVDADGVIAAGSSPCRLSGQASAGRLPNTLRLELLAQACGALPANLSGVVLADGDHRPARFRMIADNGRQLFDLWAFAE